MTTTELHKPVTSRKVFYVPGYDPFPARRYRELYRSESAAQGDISGYRVEVSGDVEATRFGWKAVGTIDGAIARADIEVLQWSDIVRDSMSQSIPATYWQLASTAWRYITTGTLRRLMWLRKGPVIAALYPVGMLLLQLLVALVAGFVVAGLLLWIANAGLAIFGWDTGVLTGALRFLIVLGVAGAVLRFFKGQDGRLFAYYLMHDYAFTARWNGANPPQLDQRLSEFAKRVADALDSDVDEVLVVGHSSGAHLAVHVLADLMRKGQMPRQGPALGFLSLGQVVPMVSFLPKATRLRADLAYLSRQDGLTWVDVTAPGDGCAFALCDPVAVSGLAPDDKRWPLVISAAFTQTLSPERWQELRWRFFRLHFQYLCAFDRPKDYDYFQITAGPLTLAARYEGRKPSASRIDVPASKYTSTAE